MLYPIWKPLLRPRFFPEDTQLDRLLASNYDPENGYFKVRMFRRNARDLRKGVFGPVGSRDVPKGRGERRFRLPNNWTLRLTYYEAPWAGEVDAEFIPPTMREWPRIASRSSDRAEEEAHP